MNWEKLIVRWVAVMVAPLGLFLIIAAPILVISEGLPAIFPAVFVLAAGGLFVVLSIALWAEAE